MPLPIGAIYVGSGVGLTWPAGGTSAIVEGIINSLTARILVSGSAGGIGYIQMANTTYNLEFSLMYQI